MAIPFLLEILKGGINLLELRNFFSILRGKPKGKPVADKANWHVDWTIEKYHGDVCPENLFAIEKMRNNLLLNDGITLLLNLLIGAGGTAYNNANTYIGVGDSTTAAAATQTGLQAATNKAWAAMDATYPQVSNQTVTFRATFGSAVGNFSWREFTIVNASSDSGTNLNRKVENHGTKASGDSWVISATVTIS